MIDNKSEYFTIVGTVTYIKKDNCMYQACPSDSCNKKVIENGPQDYRCEKCQRSYQTFSWRLMVSMSIADATGQTWVTAFQVCCLVLCCVFLLCCVVLGCVVCCVLCFDNLTIFFCLVMGRTLLRRCCASKRMTWAT